jgi:uncharacterized membrane protein YgcG
MKHIAKPTKGALYATALMKIRPSFRCKPSLLVLAPLILLSLATSIAAIPSSTGYKVNDWALIFTLEEDMDLEDFCRFIEEETTVEIYIVTTTDLEGYDINRYSYLLFNDWGIGKEDVNNGILLTFFYEDLNETHFAYDFRIEIGRGMEGAITDAEAGRIARDNFTTWFDWGYMYDGFYEGIVELYQEFVDDPSVVSGSGDPVGIAGFRAWGYANPWIAGLIVGFMLSLGFIWMQASLAKGPQCFVPLAFIIVTLLFAWWWDSSLAVLFYGIVFALGGTVVIRGAGRVRPGGGRTEGGGYTQW